MKSLSISLILVIFATLCLAAVVPDDLSAAASADRKTEKRGIYGFGHGYGGYYGGHGHGFGLGHGVGYPSYGYAVHGPIYGHSYYPHFGGYHGLH